MATDPGDGYQQRVRALRDGLDRRGLDGLVLTRRGSISYVAGVWAPWRTAVVLGADGSVGLLTSKNDLARVAAETWIDEADSWTRSRERPFPDAVADRLAAAGLGDARVGVEMGNANDVGVITAYEYRALEDRLPDLDLVAATDLVNDAMRVKEPVEIEYLRRANEMCDAGMEAAFDAIAPGVSELEVAGVIEHALRDAGSEYNWSLTRTEVGSGYRQARPNGFTPEPTTKLIQRGDLVTLDAHAVHRGYLGDLVANAVVGEPSEAQLELESMFLHVVDTLLDAIQPGAAIAGIVEAADRAMREVDQPGDWVPYYGHGLGTSARCGPTLVPEAGGELEPNTTLVAHAYVCDPDVGGLRLETPLLVTEDGTERLSKTPLELVRLDA